MNFLSVFLLLILISSDEARVFGPIRIIHFDTPANWPVSVYYSTHCIVYNSEFFKSNFQLKTGVGIKYGIFNGYFRINEFVTQFL